MHDEPTLQPVLQRLGNLRVDRSTGDPAPHKPLLLLVILDLAERGELGEVIELTPQLAFRFCSYFSVVAYRRATKPDIRLPFHHLVGDGGIWTPLLADGSVSDNRRATSRAQLSSDVLALANDPVGRDAARRLLIAKYFRPNERAALFGGQKQQIAPVEAPVRLPRPRRHVVLCRARDEGRKLAPLEADRGPGSWPSKDGRGGAVLRGHSGPALCRL